MEDTFPLKDVLPNPDWGLAADHSYSVTKASYKDGYVQRAPNGLFSRTRSFSPTWTNLSYEQKCEVVQFLDDRLGCEPFWWTTPEDEQIKVICEKGVKHTYDYYDGYTVSATFEEVP